MTLFRRMLCLSTALWMGFVATLLLKIALVKAATVACQVDYIACTSGQCIPLSWRCDGEVDCKDGSDEKECHKPICDKATELLCDQETCIPKSFACDGKPDCNDGSDEINCTFNTETCDSQQFRCNDGTCIDKTKVCDKTNNCEDGSDENKCTSLTECKKYEFQCEESGCVGKQFWCDSNVDCSDGSDEKYCKKSVLFNSNPNRCPLSYFKCENGPCIPSDGRCDGYNDCVDSSDEHNCLLYNTTTQTTSISPINHLEGSVEVEFFNHLNSSLSSAQMEQFSGLQSSSVSTQLRKARNWILSQRRGDYGWGDETHRAITALFFSDEQPMIIYKESDMLMIKQLEIKLSLELARNGTKPMKLTELALYINALLLSCKNPKNFYGDDLVAELRDGVNNAQKDGTAVNPSIYLSLCINNAITSEDPGKLHEIFLNWKATDNRIDIQALAFISTACVFQNTNFLNASMYDSIIMEFLRNVKTHGFPGNVYEAALLFRALQELKITLTGLADFLLEQQLPDGSFGDIFSTYLILPILAGRNIIQKDNSCGQRNMPDLIPLEVLKNVKSKKVQVQYSLNYGSPPELTHTLQIHLAKETDFLNVMRLAQEINPKYRFRLSKNREVPVVYSIGEMPNDAEKGMHWELYKAAGNNTEIANEEIWVPYTGDIRKLILDNGDKVLFWYKHV